MSTTTTEHYQPTETPPVDRVVWRADLQEAMNVTSETVRRWLRAGKLPAPDVQLSRKTSGWRLSTLHQAGIRIV